MSKRKSIILTERTEKEWLKGEMDFEINHNLVAISLEPRNDLFSGIF